MSDLSPDVLVLRRGAHGMSSADLAAELRDRLPDYDVVRASTPQEEREAIATAPVAVGHRLDPSLLDHAENLKLFACAAAGVGHLPLERLEELGVTVTNASGVHGPNIAEQVLGNILVFARNLHVGWERQQRREWRHFQAANRELYRSTVTVVGLGSIGEAIAERLDAFGVHTIGIRYTPEKGGPTDEVLGFEEADLHSALARSDYVVIACPLTETTRGLIGAAELETMEPHAVLVNIGRGPIVDTDALLQTVKDNAIRGAALDVTDPEPLPEDHELWGMQNVHITPHNSGHTVQYYPRVADIVAENLALVEETGNYENLNNQVN
ncbi:MULTISPECIES: D-2-hydroxyacid dehydrogenase [unclassified Haladaptatus]|uniref:D-2-hydroxyacid dehydrogenase n=1 Tax=unclassified Haladaptatus TaxID=2622732 RepID=UPI0023E8E7EC|nr:MULTISPECIES: D-2-hydroxyacid dehydrogenase [unclassified Haladaptatus]